MDLNLKGLGLSFFLPSFYFTVSCTDFLRPVFIGYLAVSFSLNDTFLFDYLDLGNSYLLNFNSAT